MAFLACESAAFGYTAVVVETTTTRGESRKRSKADNRRCAVFFRPHTLCLQWSGLGGGALAHAGSLGRRSLNPALRPATPFESGSRVIEPVQGGRIMRQVVARPEPTETPIQIINRALRAAAVAPTYQDALDVTGDALRLLAELARAEVSRA